MATNKDEKYHYEDATLPIAGRVEDLLSRMTLEEKAGQLFHNMIVIGPDGQLSKGNPDFGIDDTEVLLYQKQMTHFNVAGPIASPITAAQWHNRLQEAALKTRLRIPVTVSSDPRNAFTENIGTSADAGGFSQWPETLGFAALQSADLVESFANHVREEYMATGIRCALHPQIDVATEPRWARMNGTFGEDGSTVSSFGQAYLNGFQCCDGRESVTCIVKHFPGGGPQRDGEDPHFEYGKDQVYPGGNFSYHLEPFAHAIKTGARQIMPYYGRPIGLRIDVGHGTEEDIEEVGFAFNKQIITDLLRQKMGFYGIVCTDWGLVTDAVIMGQKMPARAWGCEDLTELERVVKIIDAGCDQFGGETRPELVVEAVQKGLVSEARVDESVRKLLAEKFWLGLFDDKRFVDVAHVDQVFDNPEVTKIALDSQRRSFTLLKNQDGVLPLSGQRAEKVYVEGLDQHLLMRRMPGISIAETPEDANLAIMRLKAPFEPRTGGFESFFHAGSLEYDDNEKARQRHIYNTVPTIVDIYLDRPAIIPEISEKSQALLVNYGASPGSFLDVLLGATVDGKSAKPDGKLPFDMPSSTAAVKSNKEDVPWDTERPLFTHGTGLSYV